MSCSRISVHVLGVERSLIRLLNSTMLNTAVLVEILMMCAMNSVSYAVIDNSYTQF